MYISCNSVAGCVSHCFYQSTQLRQNSSRGTAGDLKAKKVLTVHHSKYALAKHRWDEPLKNAEEMKNKDYLNVLIPEIGEVVTLEK